MYARPVKAPEEASRGAPTISSAYPSPLKSPAEATAKPRRSFERPSDDHFCGAMGLGGNVGGTIRRVVPLSAIAPSVSRFKRILAAVACTAGNRTATGLV